MEYDLNVNGDHGPFITSMTPAQNATVCIMSAVLKLKKEHEQEQKEVE